MYFQGFCLVDKMWQGVIESLDVVASSHYEGGVMWGLCEHSCRLSQILYERSIENSETFSKFFRRLKGCWDPFLRSHEVAGKKVLEFK